jgi:hypothetical protein
MFSSLISYADDNGGSGWQSSDAWNNSQGQDGWQGQWDSQQWETQGQDGWQGQWDSQQWGNQWDKNQGNNSAQEKFKRWKFMQVRKASGGDAQSQNQDKDQQAFKELMSDPAFSEFVNQAFESKFSQYSDKFTKIDSIENKFQAQEFLKSFSEAGKPYVDAWLKLDTESVLPLISDIETNGLTPEMIILYQNKDLIFEKLKLLPRQEMSFDDGKSVGNIPQNATMQERESFWRKKFLGS